MLFSKLYEDLSTPELNGKKIGLFRTLCAIFGGLFLAYFSMTFLTMILPIPAAESIIVPLMFNTMAWAIAALWISISPTRLSALKRSLIPTIIFIACIAYMY